MAKHIEDKWFLISWWFNPFCPIVCAEELQSFLAQISNICLKIEHFSDTETRKDKAWFPKEPGANVHLHAYLCYSIHQEKPYCYVLERRPPVWCYSKHQFSTRNVELLVLLFGYKSVFHIFDTLGSLSLVILIRSWSWVLHAKAWVVHWPESSLSSFGESHPPVLFNVMITCLIHLHLLSVGAYTTTAAYIDYLIQSRLENVATWTSFRYPCCTIHHIFHYPQDHTKSGSDLIPLFSQCNVKSPWFYFYITLFGLCWQSVSLLSWKAVISVYQTVFTVIYRSILTLLTFRIVPSWLSCSSHNHSLLAERRRGLCHKIHNLFLRT